MQIAERRRGRLHRLFQLVPFDLKRNDAMKPKRIAALIPELVTSNIPVSTPMRPCFSASASAPCVSELPKDVIGIVAPVPAKSMSGS